MRPAIVILAAAVGLSACGEKNAEVLPAPEPTPVEALVAFARAPSDATWATVPFADAVQLGLADDLVVERSADDLRDPGSWRLAASPFRGRSDTYSALELIETEQGLLTRSRGEHPHCAAGPVPPPDGFERHERVWVQPAEADGCLDWWTVDAFLNEAGKIAAVTLDLWEP